MDGKYLQTSWTVLPKLFSKITELWDFHPKGYKLKKSSSTALMTRFELDSRNAGFLTIHLTRREFGLRGKICLVFFKFSLYRKDCGPVAPHHAEPSEWNVVGLIPGSVGAAAQPPITAPSHCCECMQNPGCCQDGTKLAVFQSSHPCHKNSVWWRCHI